MALPTWPGSLPPVTNAGGATETPPQNLARSSIEGGFALQRRRGTDSARLFSEGFIMTKAQLATFDAFLAGDLAGGMLSFETSTGRSGATARLRIRGRPQYRSLGGEIWRVDLELGELPSQ